jgi:hypothetical protein
MIGTTIDFKHQKQWIFTFYGLLLPQEHLFFHYI